MGILSTIIEILTPIILFLVVISIYLLPLALILLPIILIRYSKKIAVLEISVDKKNFYKGEKIRGNLKVLLKKDLPIKKLTVCLLCRDFRHHSSNGRISFCYYKKEHHIEDTFSVGITKSIPFEFSHPYDPSEECTEQSSCRRGLLDHSSGPIYFKGLKWMNRRVWEIIADVETTGIIGVTADKTINIETDSKPDMMK